MAIDRSETLEAVRPAGAIDRMPHLASLPAAAKAGLAALRRVRHVASGELLIGEGTIPTHVGMVESGVLRMQRSLATGRQHIVGLLVSGDMFGRLPDGALGFDVEAATDGVVWTFPRAPFEALVQRSAALERAVMLSLVDELDRARDWMIVLANRKVSARVAGFLLMLCSRFAAVDGLVRPVRGAIEVTVPISRVDLAHLLGARQESISRALHALADAGAIGILSPNRFVLRNIDALLVEAGEIEVGPHLKRRPHDRRRSA